MPSKFPHSAAWDQAVAELDAFFAIATLPQTLTVPDGIITDVALFVRTHLAYIKANHNNSVFLPYAQRLRKLKDLLQHGTNNPS